jgi:hypothetical protein
MYMYVCTFVCTYARMYVCMYVRMYRCIYIFASLVTLLPEDGDRDNDRNTGFLFRIDAALRREDTFHLFMMQLKKL